LFPVVILLFPDGRLAARRWRWVPEAYAALGACATAGLFWPAISAVAGDDVHLDSFWDVISNGHTGGALAAAPAAQVAGQWRRDHACAARDIVRGQLH
jgi:hypothetical protein